MAISIGSNSSSTGSRGSGISSRLDFSNVMPLAKDFRDIYEKERTELQEQRSLIEGLKEAVRNEDPNSYAYQTFMNFYNNYDKDISEFAAHGLTPDLLRNLNWDRDQYVKGVSKIGAAVSARNALLKAADTLTQSKPDKQYLIQNDPRDLTLDDLIANPDIGLGQVIDLNALHAQVSAAGAIIRDQGLITGYNDEDKTYDRKMITTDQVNKFLLDFTGQNMDSDNDIWNNYGESDQDADDQKRVNQILGGVVGRIWDANFGNVNWITPEQENQAKNVMASALHQAISPFGGYVQPKNLSSSGSKSSSGGGGSKGDNDSMLGSDGLIHSSRQIDEWTKSTGGSLFVISPNNFKDKERTGDIELKGVHDASLRVNVSLLKSDAEKKGSNYAFLIDDSKVNTGEEDTYSKADNPFKIQAYKVSKDGSNSWKVDDQKDAFTLGDTIWYIDHNGAPIKSGGIETMDVNGNYYIVPKNMIRQYDSLLEISQRTPDDAWFGSNTHTFAVVNDNMVVSLQNFKSDSDTYTSGGRDWVRIDVANVKRSEDYTDDEIQKSSSWGDVTNLRDKNCYLIDTSKAEMTDENQAYTGAVRAAQEYGGQYVFVIELKKDSSGSEYYFCLDPTALSNTTFARNKNAIAVGEIGGFYKEEESMIDKFKENLGDGN